MYFYCIKEVTFWEKSRDTRWLPFQIPDRFESFIPKSHKTTVTAHRIEQTTKWRDKRASTPGHYGANTPSALTTVSALATSLFHKCLSRQLCEIIYWFLKDSNSDKGKRNLTLRKWEATSVEWKQFLLSLWKLFLLLKKWFLWNENAFFHINRNFTLAVTHHCIIICTLKLQLISYIHLSEYKWEHKDLQSLW